MLHTCVQRFDVTGDRGNILGSERGLIVLFRLQSMLCISQYSKGMCCVAEEWRCQKNVLYTNKSATAVSSWVLLCITVLGRYSSGAFPYPTTHLKISGCMYIVSLGQCWWLFRERHARPMIARPPCGSIAIAAAGSKCITAMDQMQLPTTSIRQPYASATLRLFSCTRGRQPHFHLSKRKYSGLWRVRGTVASVILPKVFYYKKRNGPKIFSSTNEFLDHRISILPSS
jgi:hypothetical protein